MFWESLTELNPANFPVLHLDDVFLLNDDNVDDVDVITKFRPNNVWFFSNLPQFGEILYRFLSNFLLYYV